MTENFQKRFDYLSKELEEKSSLIESLEEKKKDYERRNKDLIEREEEMASNC